MLSYIICFLLLCLLYCIPHRFMLATPSHQSKIPPSSVGAASMKDWYEGPTRGGLTAMTIIFTSYLHQWQSIWGGTQASDEHNL